MINKFMVDMLHHYMFLEAALQFCLIRTELAGELRLLAALVPKVSSHCGVVLIGPGASITLIQLQTIRLGGQSVTVVDFYVITDVVNDI